MKQVFCPNLENAVREYHEYNRDSSVKLIKFVCNPRGDPLLLVRMIDEAGNKMSCLDHYFWDALYLRWDISNINYCGRREESAMVAEYTTLCCHAE